MSASPVLASLDVGTNSVLLTVARVDENEEIVLLDQRATVTRLGQGVDQSGELHPDAQTRTLDCLRTYKQVMNEWGVERGAAVGTSALRDARGGASFVDLAGQILGFPLEVISGAREAELTFSGALLGLSVQERACVFDIGGGSTELIIGDAATGQIEAAISLNVGSVRLTERLALSDPPSAAQIEQLKAAISEQLAQFDLSRARQLTLVGVAGTVTTLSAILMGMDSYDAARVHGSVIEAQALYELSRRLLTMTVEQRLELPGLTAGRADVIGAGAALCSAIVAQVDAKQLLVSDRGVRFGLLRDLNRSVSI